MKASQKNNKQKEVYICQRQVSKRQPVIDLRTVQKKTKERNITDSKHVMSKPKTTKKRKSSMNMDDDVGMIFVTKMSYQSQMMIFMFFSESEDDIVNGELREHETQYHMDDHNAHDDLLNGYESDNRDYGPMKNSKNEHHFSRMSHVLSSEIFID